MGIGKELHADLQSVRGVRERAHKKRRAAVFSSRSGSEQGMHWSRGNGTKTCRYIKVASLHVGIRCKRRRCVVGQENIEHGHAWPAELERKLRDCRHLSRAPRCMQPRTRLERLARNGASQPAGRGPWNLDTRPRGHARKGVPAHGVFT